MRSANATSVLCRPPTRLTCLKRPEPTFDPLVLLGDVDVVPLLTVVTSVASLDSLFVESVGAVKGCVTDPVGDDVDVADSFLAESLTRCLEKHMLAIVLDRWRCIDASIWLQTFCLCSWLVLAARRIWICWILKN